MEAYTLDYLIALVEAVFMENEPVSLQNPVRVELDADFQRPRLKNNEEFLEYLVALVETVLVRQEEAKVARERAKSRARELHARLQLGTYSRPSFHVG